MDPIVVVGITLGLIVLLLITGTSLKPLKILGQGIIKVLIGAFLLFFLNIIGNNFGIHIPINLITAAISGFLGIPGLAALTVVQVFII